MNAPAMDPAAPQAPIPLFIGTAGWSLPRASQHRFAGGGPAAPHLVRYARHLPAVEINSSFYRPHERSTYKRWAAGTPPAFRFSVKLPRSITHDARLQGAQALLRVFADQVAGLGERLGCLLVQLPPSLAFDPAVAGAFLGDVRRLHPGTAVAVEPRHTSWFTPEADALLARWQAGRVLADPVLYPPGSAPGGWPGMVYCRLHGSPRIYYSAYGAALLRALATRLHAAAHEVKSVRNSPGEPASRSVWCIFDNTASGAAAGNALDLQQALHQTVQAVQAGLSGGSAGEPAH